MSGAVPEPAGEPGTESVEALAGHAVAQPTQQTYWTPTLARDAKRAALRVYLGAAPGVGKTYAMLSEGQRRRGRGTDVLVGLVQTYGRPKTTEMLEGLEVAPTKHVEYRGTAFEEMDTAAIVARMPEVVLVDELAHTNIPGSRRAKRWEDVLDLLAEGIPVITTVNVQHLESLNDVIAATGFSTWPTRSSSWTCPPTRCSGACTTATSIRIRGRPSWRFGGSSPPRT